MNEENIEYPIRINRYLALKGVSVRREADKLVEQKLVKINGRVARLGDKVYAGDVVDFSNVAARDYHYIAFNKPIGVVTHTPQDEDKSIKDVYRSRYDLFPVGRLDKESDGLIILTDDGRITDRLLNPENEHEKEYAVKVNKKISGDFRRLMSKGVVIEGYKTKPSVLIPTGEKSFRLIIQEGKKHQIRRMCTALGYEVSALRRTRIMNITLGGLASGEGRELKGKELGIFLKNLGI